MASTSGNKIGALWIRETRGGGQHMTGEVEIDGRKHRIVVFKNGYRTEENRQPHYTIYKDTPRPGEQPEATTGEPGSQSTGPARW